MSSFDASEFLANLERWGKECRPVLVEGVDEFTESTLGKAQKLCPIETGRLRDSATPGEPVDDGRTITQEMGFNTDYAAAVHERLNVHHPQGQAKFLETPLRTDTPKLGPFLGDKLAKAGFL